MKASFVMEEDGAVIAPWSARIAMAGTELSKECIEELYAGRTDTKSD